MRLLPGLYLHKKSYVSLSCVKESHIVDNICQYIGGSVTIDDWARLRDRTLTVSKFILTDATKNSEPRISSAAYFRLALSQEPGIPFFPHLSDLVIVDAGVSLSYLELLLTPSLTSLEVSSISNTNQWILFSFLTSLAQVAPLLQTLTFGPRWFPSKSIVQTILQFKNLRQLEMKDILKMTFAFLKSLGTSLPALESLILDARSCEYIPSTAIMSEDLSKGIEEHTPHASFDTHRQKRRRVSAESDVGDAFSQLMKLHIIGSPLFLRDLILQIASTRLRDVFITVVTGMQAVNMAQTSKQKKKKQIQKEEENLKKGEKRMRAINERKKVGETNDILFSALLQLLHGRWSTCLKTISVVNASGHSPQSTLLNEAFRLLLLHPTIKNLTVEGWTPDSVEDSILGLAELTPSNLKSLFLPLEANSGVSWSTLRHVAITCPKLQSLQCRIKPLSPMPEYSTAEALFHGLRTLSVGNSSWDLQSNNKHHLIARHLDHLFPHLETITTFNHSAEAEPWNAVDELVKMCQTARMDQRYRAYAIQAATDAMIT